MKKQKAIMISGLVCLLLLSSSSLGAVAVNKTKSSDIIHVSGCFIDQKYSKILHGSFYYNMTPDQFGRHDSGGTITDGVQVYSIAHLLLSVVGAFHVDFQQYNPFVSYSVDGYWWESSPGVFTGNWTAHEQTVFGYGCFMFKINNVGIE